MIYMLPLYNNLPLYLRNKLHKILMKSARSAIGNYCYKKSTSYILNKCKWLNINNMIKYSSINLLHNILNKNEPKIIINMLKINRRSVVDINTKYIPQSRELKSFFIYKSLKLYNAIPKELKHLETNKFKKALKKYIENVQVSDTYD